jgi:hypothetical protein
MTRPGAGDTRALEDRGEFGAPSCHYLDRAAKVDAGDQPGMAAVAQRGWAGDQLGGRNSGFSRERRSVHPTARANSSKNAMS